MADATIQKTVSFEISAQDDDGNPTSLHIQMVDDDDTVVRVPLLEAVQTGLSLDLGSVETEGSDVALRRSWVDGLRDIARRIEQSGETGSRGIPHPASTDAPVSLRECPVGLFMYGGELCLKTEYGNNEGRIDAYIVSSGEFFWGDQPQTIARQNAQLVYPIDAAVIVRLLSDKTGMTPKAPGESGGVPS